MLSENSSCLLGAHTAHCYWSNITSRALESACLSCVLACSLTCIQMTPWAVTGSVTGSTPQQYKPVCMSACISLLCHTCNSLLCDQFLLRNHSLQRQVLVQGEAAVQAGNWPEAEGFFLRAKQPEAALAMYRKARMWSEALRIAEDYLPDRVRTFSRCCSGHTVLKTKDCAPCTCPAGKEFHEHSSAEVKDAC